MCVFVSACVYASSHLHVHKLDMYELYMCVCVQVHQLGMYESEEAAAQAWDRVAAVYRPDNQLNFPELRDAYNTEVSCMSFHALLCCYAIRRAHAS